MADHLNRNDISASEYEKIHRAFEESLIDYLLVYLQLNKVISS